MIDVLMPGGSDRLRETAAMALEGTAHRFLSAGDDLRGKRVLFALSVDEGGMDAPTLALLRRLRLEKNAMRDSCAAVLLDGAGELYTKQLAQDVVLAANGAGCAFMGNPSWRGRARFIISISLPRASASRWSRPTGRARRSLPGGWRLSNRLGSAARGC